MLPRLGLALAVFTLHCACQPLRPTEAYAPEARINSTYTVSGFILVVLDGNQSSDPNGDPLTFEWSFRSRPSGSAAAIALPTSANSSFIPDVQGEYVVQLVVSDGKRKSTPATLHFIAWNTPPLAEADETSNTVVSTAFTLSGRATDWEHDPLTYSWTLTQRPTGSTTTLTGADTPTPTFIPDVEGDYLFSFVVHDGHDASTVLSVTVTAHRPIHLLSHRVIDAEYSKALDRLVMVSDNPNALYLYDPETRTETSVALPKPPTSVSVGPDGRFAAVGHDALVSYVDLTTPTLLKTLPVSTDVVDIILAGNGYAYALQPEESFPELHSLHLSTGEETRGFINTTITRARLHPSGTALYAANDSHDSSYIDRYSLSTGPAQLLYRSPNFGLLEVCGDLWFSEDGALIFTRCGHTFNTSDNRGHDMSYAGSLPGTNDIRHMSHSTEANRIALVPGPKNVYPSDPLTDTKVHLHLPESLDFDRSVALSPFMKEGKAYAGHGRFVFFNAAGDKMLVILQADPESAMAHAYGLVTY